ncbi:hypothetical protein BWO91_16980 [Plantibacter flavus]|uniref:hypothetical protein n=1 Tax=Plantibacter flavus TaxID=150123 RepID=UPI00099DB681|nr:hypothetical protein [Plantibacter flavus]AQX81426.1 hypothetical protein BWO91_16980 [Plantibacter flavus]
MTDQVSEDQLRSLARFMSSWFAEVLTVSVERQPGPGLVLAMHHGRWGMTYIAHPGSWQYIVIPPPELQAETQLRWMPSPARSGEGGAALTVVAAMDLYFHVLLNGRQLVAAESLLDRIDELRQVRSIAFDEATGSAFVKDRYDGSSTI